MDGAIYFFATKPTTLSFCGEKKLDREFICITQQLVRTNDGITESYTLEYPCDTAQSHIVIFLFDQFIMWFANGKLQKEHVAC